MNEQPQDIGAVVAIVGIKGWQCKLCSTTFPRSFSIDHHMMANHHPLDQQEPAPPHSVITAPSSRSSDHFLNQEVDDIMEDVSTANASNKASGENSRVGKSSSGSIGFAPIGSETCNNVLSAAEGGRSWGRDGESARIKVEPGLNTLHQESLPLRSDKTFEQQSVSSSVDMDSTSLCEQGSTTRKHQSGVEMTQRDSDWTATLIPAERCSPWPSVQGDRAGGRCPGPQKAASSLKPYKVRTCSCGQQFESKPEYRHHRRVVHCRLKHKAFVCHICNAEYQQKRGLNRHLYQKGETPIPCSQCPKQFHDQNSLEEHQKHCQGSEAHNSKPSVSERVVDSTDNSIQNSSFDESEKAGHLRSEDSFPWECSKCKKHFVEKCKFRKHLVECGILVWKDGKRHFTCNLCGTSFSLLVQYHRHYVLDHKLAFLNESSSARFSPFMGNSPVPSPVPSVTSEINTAMAGVSLNQSRPMDVTENSSPNSSIIDLTSDTSLPFSSTIDLTSDAGCDEDVKSRVQEDISRLVSNPQIRSTAHLKSDLTTAATVSASNPSLSSSLPTVSDSSGPLSLSTTASSLEPPSLGSTTGSSSDQRSFPSDYTSSCPLSLTSASSGQTSDRESIVISDTEGSDSSSDSDDEEWEIITDQGREKEEAGKEKKTGPDGVNCGEAGKGEDFSFGDFFGPPHPGHHFHPPPHPPHPAHHFPPPPPFFPPHGRFPPPFHAFHHHRPRCDRGAFMRGRFMHRGFMRGCMAFFGASRFGPPGWFGQEDGASDNSQQSKNATATSCGEAADTSSKPTCSAAPHQENAERQSAQEQENSANENTANAGPFSHAENFCKWAGKWKEGKASKMMWKRMFCSMFKNFHGEGESLLCPECMQTFTEESELEKHCRENHPTTVEFICFLCQQAFSEPVPYSRHIRQHCENFFHMRGRGRGWGFRGMGRKIFKQLWKGGGPYDMFGSHLFSHGHQHQEASDNDSNSPDTSSKDFKECPVCNKRYRANSRESFFERHVNSHYGVEVYSYKCEECGKKFLEKGKFTAHQAKHKASPFVCQVCGKNYQSKTSLTRHERIHTGERPHKCPDCGEGFIELRELERHRMKHTGQDPFQCKVCNKGFTLKDSLLNHIRKQHPDESPVLVMRRAMDLSGADQPHKQHSSSKDGLSSETQAGSVTTVKEEKGSTEQQELTVMELD
ncbi:uncharacterized protein LOC143286134 isoform X2 [Babylonia areolata]